MSAGWVALVAGLVSCAAAGDPAGAGGGSGTGGTTSVVDGGADAEGGSAAAGAGGADAGPEPQGATVLTVVNGLGDARRVRLCFAKRVAGANSFEASGAPLPSGDLAYASSFDVALAGVDLARDELLPILIAARGSDRLDAFDCTGLLERALGASNADAGSDADVDASLDGSDDAAPSDAAPADATPADAAPADAAPADAAPSDAGTVDLRLTLLPALPPGTLTSGLSRLMVLAGCAGGARVSEANAAQICGANFAPGRPTLRTIFVARTRITAPDRIGIQLLHAMPALERGALRTISDDGTVTRDLAPEIAYGALGPRPPYAALAALDVATSRENLVFVSPQGPSGGVVEAWRNALGDVTLRDGTNYVVVAIGGGATPTSTEYNPPRLVVLPTR